MAIEYSGVVKGSKSVAIALTNYATFKMAKLLDDNIVELSQYTDKSGKNVNYLKVNDREAYAEFLLGAKVVEQAVISSYLSPPGYQPYIMPRKQAPYNPKKSTVNRYNMIEERM